MNEREILEQLIIEGRITEEDVARASDRAFTEEKAEVIDLLHTKFCRLNHDINDQLGHQDECRWYIEEQFEDMWRRPYHFAWVKLLDNLLASTKLIKFIPETVAEEPSGSSDGSLIPD